MKRDIITMTVTRRNREDSSDGPKTAGIESEGGGGRESPQLLAQESESEGGEDIEDLSVLGPLKSSISGVQAAFAAVSAGGLLTVQEEEDP